MDGRPLSNNRGIGQEISKIFKSYILSSASKTSKQEISKSISDPFLALQISCPRGTYDVNIEPAKDDIMFEDRELVLALVSDLFRDHYGEVDGAEESAPKENKINASHPGQVSNGFDLLMAKKPASETPTHSLRCFSSGSILDTPLSPKGLTSAYEISSSENSRTDLSEAPDVPNDIGSSRLGFVNPRSILTTNFCLQTPRRERIPPVTSSPSEVPRESPNIQMQRQYGTRSAHRSSNSLELIRTPRLTPRSPVRPSRQQPQSSTDPCVESSRTPSSRRRERDRDRERYGNGALDTWFQRVTQSSIQQTPPEDMVPVQEPNGLPLSSLTQERFGIPFRVSQEIGDYGEQNEVHPTPSPGGTPQQSASNDTFAPNYQNVQVPMSMDSGRGFPVLERWAAQLHQDGSSEEPTDLEKALDFEKRKKEAIQSRRMKLTNANKSSSSQLALVPHSSQNSRYLAAKAALTSSQTSVVEPISATKLSPNDPRCYLMRQIELVSVDEVLEHDANAKARRLRTSRLPLERIPDGLDLHDLSITYSTDASSKFEIFKHCIREDMYLENGDEAAAFSPYTVDTCVPFWNQRLGLLIEEQYDSKDGSSLQRPKIDISPIISHHLKTFDTR